MRLLQQLLTWWRDHSLASLIVTGGAVAAAVLKYLDVGGRVAVWVRSRKTNALKRYIPGEDQKRRVLAHILPELLAEIFPVLSLLTP